MTYMVLVRYLYYLRFMLIFVFVVFTPLKYSQSPLGPCNGGGGGGGGGMKYENINMA